VNRATITLAATATAALTLSAAPASAGEPVHTANPLVSYDAALVPAGATATLHAVEAGRGESARTIVTLHVKGLQPNREYGAHAHYLPCGSTGAAAGAHYQYEPDPAALGSLTTPSVNPAYANPENEIWLDLTTNAAGNGVARAIVDWHLPDTHQRASSVIIHTQHTDHTGAAGTRLACISVPF